MKCLNCGAEILTNTCVLCGTKLTPEQEEYIDGLISDQRDTEGWVEQVYLGDWRTDRF